ncbi:MAG: TetR/AcrR family transcriptional regulator [Microscillaceae bacterium]|nr:TetR/AcrR family transcriptional regulator [Microscillaceae bacterium]
MPTATFQKLNPEKKEKLIQIAYQEFAQHNYENASISRIVAAADMAKGSFYQYFGKEAKKDLYLYLIELANRKKQEALGAILRERFSDFFVMFRKMYEAGLSFDLENPLYSRFLTNVSLEKHSPDLGDLQQLTKKQALEYFAQLIKNEQRKGIIRTDLSVEVIAFVVVQIGTGLLDFFYLKHASNSVEQAIEPHEISTVLEQVVEIMQHGLNN